MLQEFKIVRCESQINLYTKFHGFDVELDVFDFGLMAGKTKIHQCDLFVYDKVNNNKPRESSYMAIFGIVNIYRDDTVKKAIPVLNLDTEINSDFYIESETHLDQVVWDWPDQIEFLQLLTDMGNELTKYVHELGFKPTF